MTNQENNKQHLPPVPPPYPYYAPPQEDEINLLDLWKILIEQKKLILFITAIITLTAITYALLATPIYRAEALLAPVQKEKNSGFNALAGQFGSLASLAGVNLNGSKGNIQVSIATLRSRELTYRLIEEEDLMPVMFKKNWDESMKQWRKSKKPPTLWKAYKIFDSSRNISIDRKTGLITLTIDWDDPVLAAELVGKLVVRTNKKLREEAILNAKESIKYLKAELQKTSIVEIKESIYNLIEGHTKTMMLANTKEEYAFRVLDRALVAERPIKPKRIKIIIIGIVIGGIIGIFAAFIRRAIINAS